MPPYHIEPSPTKFDIFSFCSKLLPEYFGVTSFVVDLERVA